MGQDIHIAERAGSCSSKSFKRLRCHRSGPVSQGLLLGRLTIFLLLKVSDLLRLIMSLNRADRQTLPINVLLSPSSQRHEISRRPLRHLLAAGTWK